MHIAYCLSKKIPNDQKEGEGVKDFLNNVKKTAYSEKINYDIPNLIPSPSIPCVSLNHLPAPAAGGFARPGSLMGGADMVYNKVKRLYAHLVCQKG